MIQPLTTETQAAEQLAWERLCDDGREAVGALDTGRWIIGDLALMVDKHYGENRLNDFAAAIQLEYAAVKVYRRVSRFWTPEIRISFTKLPGVSYSHMRLATRLKTHEAAQDFIEDVSFYTWTVSAAIAELNKRLGKPTPPKKLLDAVGDVVRVAEAHGRAVVTLALAPGVSLWNVQKIDGARVRVVLSEDKE